MSDDFLLFRSSRIHYTVWGTGDQLLFAFHGYGESAASFSILGEELDPVLTFVAIDLPFHGRTEWKEGLFLSPADLVACMEEIAVRLAARREKWWLLGYSMGGRVALELLEQAPERIEKMVLLA